MKLCTWSTRRKFRRRWRFLALCVLCNIWSGSQISSIPPIDLGERGGEDRNAQAKCQVQDVLGTFLRFLWLFSKMFVAWRDKHQNKKGAKVPTFPFLVVWTEKCVSGVIFWRAWGSKKRGFDCIFAVFSRFQLKSYFFDIKHAKCDLTVKNQ